MDDSAAKMTLDWMRKIHQLEYAHRYQSIWWSNLNLFLGIPSLAMAAAIGVIAKSAGAVNSLSTSFFLVVFGVTVSILSGLQTFLKPLALAEKHRSASAAYEQLRHRIELFFGQNMENPADLKTKLEAIRKDWSKLDALNVSTSNFLKAKEKVNSFGKYPAELSFLPSFE